MVKKKQPYESPEISATRVELESSICAGSVDFDDPNSKEAGKIEAQTINKEFSSTNANEYFNTGWNPGQTTTE